MRALICETVKKMNPAGVVMEATNGVDALRQMAERKPDVIMTDINMPEMDGFTFIERVLQWPDHAATPIIVLTTDDAPADRLRAWHLGVRTYVTKPIRQGALIAAIKSVVGDIDPGTTPMLRIDYDSPDDLLEDYAASLSRGEILVAYGRALPIGTSVTLTLAWPGQRESLHLYGVVRFSSGGAEPTLAIDLVDVKQREELARIVEELRS